MLEEEISSKDEDMLQEFRTLISYLYSSPHRTFGDTFLSDDHASIFVFKPKEVSIHVLAEDRLCELVGISSYPTPDERGQLPGYEVSMNFHTHFWVTSGSQIFPPSRSFWLNLSQDIHLDLQKESGRGLDRSIIETFEKGIGSPELKQRVMTALTWYNRANSLNVEDDVALVNLAVAFETLLSLEQGPNLTKRFRQTISVLLSGGPRLDSWLTQFYRARSAIIHRGRIEDFRFIAVDSPKNTKANAKKYRSLIDDGRQIFQLCLRTILTGATLADEINLMSRLYTNQERFEIICRVLSKSDLSPEDRFESIMDTIEETNEYRFIGETGLELNTLVDAARIASSVFVEAGYSAPIELRRLLVDLSGSPKNDDHLRALSIICKIHDDFSQLQEREIENYQSFDKLKTLLLLIDAVWNYTFMYYYWIRKRVSQASPDGSD